MLKVKARTDGILEERLHADRERRERPADKKVDLEKAYANLKKAALAKDWWWPEGSR